MLNLKHPDGSRWQKRINLELPVKNNLRRAEEYLQALRVEDIRQQQIQNGNGKMLASDYLWSWLDKKKPLLSPTTHHGYKHIIECHMEPYFSQKTMFKISCHDIESYYEELKKKGLSGTTIQHHHMILKQVFYTACRTGIIEKDPMIYVDKPKREKPNVNYYSQEEASKLWEVVKDHKLEIVVKLALYYGFRRSEVLGLKWSDVDFSAGTVAVNRAVVNEFSGEGKMTVRDKAELKGSSSRRTMPMSDLILDLLKNEKEKKLGFNNEYVCTDFLVTSSSLMRLPQLFGNC